MARDYLSQGALFVGIGTDALLLVNAATLALATVKETTADSPASPSIY